MLYSTPSVRFQNAMNNQVNYRNTAPSEMSGSGSTIASIAFTNRKSFDKGPEGTFNMSITDMQDLNSKANYEYFLKFSGENKEGTQYSDDFEYSDTFNLSATDDRAIKAAGYYDLDTIDEEPSVSAYSDDRELTQVVDLYKNQIEKSGTRQPEDLDSPCDARDRAISTDRKTALMQKCVSQMGQALFEEVYSFLVKARRSDTPDDMIFEAARQKWGKAANSHCLLVDQLIFLEQY